MNVTAIAVILNSSTVTSWHTVTLRNSAQRKHAHRKNFRTVDSSPTQQCSKLFLYLVVPASCRRACLCSGCCTFDPALCLWMLVNQWSIPQVFIPWTLIGDSQEASGSKLQLSSALVHAVSWGVNQQVENHFSPSPSFSAKSAFNK